MTEKKAPAKKAKVVETAPINKGDLKAIVTAIILTQGQYNSVNALELADYIIKESQKV